jgi:hypothetical protein
VRCYISSSSTPIIIITYLHQKSSTFLKKIKKKKIF